MTIRCRSAALARYGRSASQMTQIKHPKKPSSTGKARPFTLTPRHKQFCRNIVAGMSQQLAFRDAGFTGGWTGGPTAFLRRPAIQQYIELLQAKQRLRLNVTLDGLALNLRTGQDLAVETGNAAAYVAATMGLAKLFGFLKEEREGDINVYINRPLREPTKEIELTPEAWVRKWSPKEITSSDYAPAEDTKPNGSSQANSQNGHSSDRS
jgi:hypothetical protein